VKEDESEDDGPIVADELTAIDRSKTGENGKKF